MDRLAEKTMRPDGNPPPKRLLCINFVDEAEALTHLFANSGYTVLTANTSAQMLPLLSELDVRAALLNYDSISEEAETMATELKFLKPDTPVILLTSSTSALPSRVLWLADRVVNREELVAELGELPAENSCRYLDPQSEIRSRMRVRGQPALPRVPAYAAPSAGILPNLSRFLAGSLAFFVAAAPIAGGDWGRKIWQPVTTLLLRR